TSSIQDEIVSSVADANVFMVGDVKQSIYRFRHANPTLFLERSRAFAAGEGGKQLDLNRNFRSTRQILAAVNRLFRQILTEASGEIDYNDAQALVPADAAPTGEAVRLLLVDVHRAVPLPDASGGEDQPAVQDPAAGEDEPDNDGLEGMAIMANIRQLLSEGVPAESIAVLGRTHRICRYVAQALDLAGIPHTLADGQGFLGTPELLLMEALVSLLDNAAQDLPLAAVMRSRLHADPEDPGSGCLDGFSEELLLAIRVASDADIASAETADPPRPYFHQAVAWYAQHGPDPMLRDCTAGFLAWLDSLRAREPYLRLTELLALVFERSGYLEYVSQLPDGARRAEELALFSRWADAFESGSQRGLHRFARHLAALRESGMEDSPFEAERTVAGRVRFMTVHGSKGLEFDHVFVAGCGKSLRSRASGRILFAERSGLGPDFVDPVRSVTYPTYARLAMERSLRNASMAEEMRLLYVAMTRAARRLWLTAGIDLDPEKGAPPIARRLRAVRRAGESLPALPAHLPLSAQSFLDWIVMSMARDPDIDWSRIAGTSDPEELLATDAGCASVPQESGHILLEIRSRQEVISAAGLASGLANTPDAPSAPETPAVEDDRMARRLLVDRLTGPRDAAYADDGVYLGARAHFEKLLLSVYRYPAAASSAAKISVSERKRRAQAYIEAGEAAGEESASEPADWLQGTGLEIRVAEATAAGTRTPGMLTGADRGTAIHAVLRYLDLHSLGDMPSEEAILRQIRQMLECEMLTPVETAAVEPLAPLFLRYAQSALGHRVRTAERLGHVYREMPFTLRFDACDIHTEQDPAGFAPGDATLVQGIIDLWFEEAGKEGVVLVDFKSDRISGSPDQVARTLEERYRIQFDHYVAAIERSTGKTVISRIIWLFDAARGFDIG
ncbi:MAG TPA: 3'-5' exonuclease, partial [Clostridia bacterium]